MARMKTGKKQPNCSKLAARRKGAAFAHAIGDRFPNTGFAQIRDIERTAGSDEIYEYLIPDELTQWLSSFVRK